MKLLRYGPVGNEKPAVIGAGGAMFDLSGQLDDLTPASLRPDVLSRLAKLDLASLTPIAPPVRIGVPLRGIGKFLGIGLNYSDHAAESKMAVPTEPIIFTKATSCLVGPNDDVMLPKDSRKADWEVELGVVIGRTARYVTESEALSFVAGYVLVNDVSEREYQLERGSQWDKGKGFDTFGPVGPWLVTADEVADPQSLSLFLNVNGRRMQTGNTKTMIFSVRQLVSYVSTCMTLFPGDLVTTGTPPGVGMGIKPQPVFLRAGDSMHLGIDKLGEQRQRVVAWHHRGEEILI